MIATILADARLQIAAALAHEPETYAGLELDLRALCAHMAQVQSQVENLLFTREQEVSP